MIVVLKSDTPFSMRYELNLITFAGIIWQNDVLPTFVFTIVYILFLWLIQNEELSDLRINFHMMYPLLIFHSLFCVYCLLSGNENMPFPVLYSITSCSQSVSTAIF
ncbi:hypothetical protein VNO77_10562 [Canavalia gladiata]|uniref:Uncharacterized protein n=1 Tax=Canavalia gladiata TaxID=3824 RepID=A0AAN9MFZ7_CANGL